MVSKGQFLERPTLIPVGQDVLEGFSHRGDSRPPLLIVPPPPEQGSMDHPVLAEVAWAAAQVSFPTLRFNFRGVGASQGKVGTAQDRLRDTEAALRILEENTFVASVAVAAFAGSAATIIALQALHPGTSGLCFISPSGIDFADLARVRVPLIAIVGEVDTSLPHAALAACVSEAGGRLEIIPGADANFQRNLPEVGKAVVRWLNELVTR